MSKWERGRDRLSTQTQWQEWPLCQLVPHQFEEVKSAPGRLCLAWSHYRRSAGPRPNLWAWSPLSQQSDLHFPRTSLASHWGQVRKPLGRGASSSKTAPFKPLGGGGGDPTGSNCQLARQRRGKPGTEDRRREEESGERWQGVRCELSGETFVRQLCGGKHRCWVEAGCSHIIVMSTACTSLCCSTVCREGKKNQHHH